MLDGNWTPFSKCLLLYVLPRCIYISGMVSTCCLHLATCHARCGGLYQSAYSPASGLLPVYSQSAPGLLSDCSWSHLSLLPVYFQSVSSLLQVCYKSTSSMFPACSHSASRRLAVYFQPASMLLVKYLSRGLKFAINGWTVCSSSKLHSPFLYFPVGVHCLIVLAVIALQSSRHDEIRKLKLWKRLTKTLRVYLY